MKPEIQPPLMSHERLVRWSVLGVVLLGLALIVVKAVGWPVPVMPCGFRAASGLPCAMCGGTRSASELLQGNLKRALEWNALAVPALGLAVLGSAICLIELVRGRALFDWSLMRKWPARFLVPGIVLLLAWWMFHVHKALENPDSGLADRGKPLAAAVADFLGIR